MAAPAPSGVCQAALRHPVPGCFPISHGNGSFVMQSEKKRVTLQDIAERSGFSINTVSHALRNKSDISQETCQRIQAIAKEMGYTGNQIARSLRSGRTHVIAVIVSGLSNPFYSLMAEALQSAAKVKNYNVMIMCSEDDPELELRLAEDAIARCADGIVLFPNAGSRTTIDRLRDSRIPFVQISRTPEEGLADLIVWDDTEGAYLATRHLIDSGRRKLVYVSWNNVVYSSEHRTEGFNKACDEAGIPPQDRVYLTSTMLGTDCDYSLWLKKLVERLITLKSEGFDGLFVFCDIEAWHVMNEIDLNGRLSRSDFGIVSIDNLKAALSFPLPLCSVGYSFRDVAENAIRLLRNRIHGDTVPPQKIVLPVELVCRGSCNKKHA